MVANPKLKSLPLSEKENTALVKSFLESKNWLVIRLQSGLLRTADHRFLRVGKPGTPDFIAVLGCYMAGYAKTLFLEIKKSKGGTLSPDQIAWHTEAKKKNLTVMVVEDFADFRRMYDQLFPKNGICDDITVPLELW